MATNYLQEGRVVDWTNGGSDVLSGAIVVIGSNGDAVLGVAIDDIAAGAVGAVGVEGVWDVAKADAAVIEAGEYVLWDASASNVDDNQAVGAAGDVADGAWAVESKGATTGATIAVKLTGQPGVLS